MTSWHARLNKESDRNGELYEANRYGLTSEEVTQRTEQDQHNDYETKHRSLRQQFLRTISSHCSIC